MVTILTQPPRIPEVSFTAQQVRDRQIEEGSRAKAAEEEGTHKCHDRAKVGIVLPPPLLYWREKGSK